MKTTRFILAFAAALSLGLAVFANVRTHGSVTASTQSTINSDAALFDGDSAANGIKVAATGCAFTGQAPKGLQVAGTAGVPNGVTAVVLNLTATDATANSYLTAYPDLTTQPLASNLNFGPGQTVPNLVIATVGSDGKVNVANRFGNVDIVADMFGYYTN